MTQSDKKRYNRKPRLCEACGEEFIPKRWNSKYCSMECFAMVRRGVRPSLGKTYDIVTKDGTKRRLVLTEDGKHVAEHRIIFEQYWGVKLKKWHRIKHVNGDTLDNRIENLVLDNEYAMELLRQGKSITEVGHTICNKGHERTRIHHLANGTTRYACDICGKENSRQRYVAKPRKRGPKSPPPSE